MRIQKITLNNFQGIKALEINANGENVTIRGDNATGKTTIANAITWLLFGKSLDGAKNFAPKTKDSDGNDIHGIENSVEGIFTLDDGQQINLKRVFKEIWKKIKGRADSTFSGNTTEYYVNGVSIPLKQYEEQIERICPPDRAKILTNPLYFGQEMAWEKRRDLLLELFGDVSDIDVIDSDVALMPLKKMLLIPGTDRYYSIDDFKKIAKGNSKKINEQLTSIPTRIDEAEKAVPDVTGLTKKSINESIRGLKDQRSATEKQISNLSIDSVLERLKIDLSRVVVDIARERQMHDAAEYDKNKHVLQERKKLQEEFGQKKMDLSGVQFELSRKQNELSLMVEAKEALLKEYEQVRAEPFVVEDVCPTCGQVLPSEKVEKALENLKEIRSNRLEKISVRGKGECGKDMIAALEAQVSDFSADIEELEESMGHLKLQIDRIVVDPAIPFESTEKYAELMVEKQAIQAKIEDGSVDIIEAEKPLKFNVDDLSQEIAQCERLLLNIDIAKNQKVRINQLKEQEKELALAYEMSENSINLCDLFLKTKVKLLTETINRFKTVRFRLFEEQINGGIRECCDVMVNSKEGLVPYAFANNAGKINAGIEIINALSQHWAVTMPLIIDNAEAVTHLEASDNQMIELIVDGDYEELYVNNVFEILKEMPAS